MPKVAFVVLRSIRLQRRTLSSEKPLIAAARRVRIGLGRCYGCAIAEREGKTGTSREQ